MVRLPKMYYVSMASHLRCLKSLQPSGLGIRSTPFICRCSSPKDLYRFNPSPYHKRDVRRSSQPPPSPIPPQTSQSSSVLIHNKRQWPPHPSRSKLPTIIILHMKMILASPKGR